MRLIRAYGKEAVTMIQQPWYTHNQAEYLMLRLRIALDAMGLPYPSADEGTVLVDSLVSVRKFHRDEDWRWLMPQNPLGVTGIILTVGTFVLMCKNNTRRHPLTDELRRRIFDTPLTTEYDDIDKETYLRGLIYGWHYVYVANQTINWAHAGLHTVEELKHECLTRYANGNKAWRDAVEASFGHLRFAFQKAEGQVGKLGAMPMRYFTERVMVEAFAADKPEGFDLSAFLRELGLA